MSQEKKMLNDVDDRISKVSIDENDLFGKTLVVIELTNNVILRSQEKYQDKIESEIDCILDTQIEERKLELKYKGRTQIRSDVLTIFKNIADMLHNCQLYPKFTRKYVEAIVKTILVEPDPRVFKEYMKSINDTLENRLDYREVDISSFYNSVNRKIREYDNQ